MTLALQVMQTTAVVARPLFAGLQLGAHVREQHYRNYLSTITGFVDLSKTVIEMKSEHESNFIAALRTPASIIGGDACPMGKRRSTFLE